MMYRSCFYLLFLCFSLSLSNSTYADLSSYKLTNYKKDKLDKILKRAPHLGPIHSPDDQAKAIQATAGFLVKDVPFRLLKFAIINRSMAESRAWKMALQHLAQDASSPEPEKGAPGDGESWKEKLREKSGEKPVVTPARKRNIAPTLLTEIQAISSIRDTLVADLTEYLKAKFSVGSESSYSTIGEEWPGKSTESLESDSETLESDLQSLDPIELLKADHFEALNEANCKLDPDPKKRWEFISDSLHAWLERVEMLAVNEEKNHWKETLKNTRKRVSRSEITTSSEKHHEKNPTEETATKDPAKEIVKTDMNDLKKVIGDLEKKGHNNPDDFSTRTLICDRQGILRAMARSVPVSEPQPRKFQTPCVFLTLLATSPFNFTDDGKRIEEGKGAGREAFLAVTKKSLSDPLTEGCVYGSPLWDSEAFYQKFRKDLNSVSHDKTELRSSIRKLFEMRESH